MLAAADLLAHLLRRTRGAFPDQLHGLESTHVANMLATLLSRHTPQVRELSRQVLIMQHARPLPFGVLHCHMSPNIIEFNQ